MRVLFTTTPGVGHIHPMVPLARAFAARGDEVLWSTSPGACGLLEGEGFAAEPSGLDAGPVMAEVARRWPELQDLPPPERPDYLFPRLFGTLHAGPRLADLLPVARRFGPDLVVHDTAELAGPIAAAVLGVPSVSQSFGALLPARRVAAGGDHVADLWAAHGLEPRPFAGCYEHGYLDIYPPTLQDQHRPHVPVTHRVRPDAYAAGDGEPPPWPDAVSARPLVYVTLGTVFSDEGVLSTVVRALRDLPLRLVATVGPQGDPGALGPQPDHVHVARYIPQARLLPACAAVVSHAGSGTFLAALAAGLPQLCLPQAADQFLNAEAGARSGAAITLRPGEVTAEAVAAAVEALLADSSYRSAAERLAGEIASMPPPAEVAAALAATYG